MSKKLKGKDLNMFIRYGGLNLKKQKRYNESDFHIAPVSRGIYAFPLCAVEIFLVCSLSKSQPDILPNEPIYPVHKEINNELSDEDYREWIDMCNNFDWDKHENREKKILSIIKRTFKKSKGNIWHHLIDYVKHKDIIDIKNSWVKTTIKVWQKAIVKSSLNDRYNHSLERIHNINNTKLFGCVSKDHYEVFFDEKV